MLEPPSPSDIRSSLVKYATFCLSRRPYFAEVLHQKLIQRAKKLKFDNFTTIIKEILEDIKKAGFLDDIYLAQAYARRQLEKCYGPRVISLKLGRMKLNRDTIDIALEEAGIEKQLEAIKKYSLKYPKLDKYRLTNKLYGRGFSGQAIRKLFDVEYLGD